MLKIEIEVLDIEMMKIHKKTIKTYILHAILIRPFNLLEGICTTPNATFMKANSCSLGYEISHLHEKYSKIDACNNVRYLDIYFASYRLYVPNSRYK